MSNSKKPLSKVVMYPISAAIWRNENDKGEAWYNVTFERSFKNDAGEWQSSGTFNAGDFTLAGEGCRPCPFGNLQAPGG